MTTAEWMSADTLTPTLLVPSGMGVTRDSQVPLLLGVCGSKYAQSADVVYELAMQSCQLVQPL